MKLLQLDQFSKLVKDYVASSPSSPLKEYFRFEPLNFEPAFESFVKSRAESWHRDEHLRTTITSLIHDQHVGSGTLTPYVEEHIHQLGEPTSVAILTGQQVTLFGGPLYTLYKAATAISLSRTLRERYPNFNFVPIFWLETEDHDFQESSATFVLDGEFSIRRISYEPQNLPPQLTPGTRPWRGQVGKLGLETDSLASAFAELHSALAPTEFTEEILGLLKRCYEPGVTFGIAFARLLTRLFESDGLLTIDANDARAKTLGRELFKKELQTSPALSERIIVRTAALEERYHAQVKPRALNLFYLDQGERFALVEKEGLPKETERTFFLQGTKRTLTLSELLAQIDVEPERFSPNVVMRPLYQDTILPTVAYVAGPGEIAYYAQFHAAYDWASIPMPMIVPRVTATIVEDRFEQLAQKLRLSLPEFLRDGRAGVRRYLERLSDSTLAPKFEDATESIDRSLESLRETVTRTDSTLADALTTLKGKMLTQLRDFLAKTLAADRKRYAAIKAKLEKLLNAVLPHEALQERELSLIYFVNKYGLDFWGALKQSVFDHALEMDEHHLFDTTKLLADAEKSGLVAKGERTSGLAASLVAVPAEEHAS